MVSFDRKVIPSRPSHRVILEIELFFVAPPRFRGVHSWKRIEELLLRLEDDGLVEVAPRRGIFVAPIDLLDHLDLLETRRQLDSLLMKFAVRRARAEHYENLRDCAGKMQQAAENKDTEEFLRQDRRFDAIVYEAARNHSAVAAVARLHSHCRRFWYAYQRETDLARSAAHHTAIMYAIASRDEKAAVPGHFEGCGGSIHGRNQEGKCHQHAE